MKPAVRFIFLLLLLPLAGRSQSALSFRPGLLIPASGLSLYTPGQMNSGKHGFHFRRSARKGYLPVKKVAPVKHVSFLRKPARQERVMLEYQSNNMGFEVRRYLHRHKHIPAPDAPSTFSAVSGKSPESGYYLGTDIFDQFAESPLPGVIPDYSTTGMFGYYASQNKTYLTFHNAFGARAELGYQSLKRYGMVFDFSVKAGFQYVENADDQMPVRLIQDQAITLGNHQALQLLPTILCTTRIGWSE